MIKKLNNKGLTAIEILICFSIVMVIVISMFKVITNQKDKQTIESYKNEVITLKNTMMKQIESDIEAGNGLKNSSTLGATVCSEGVEGDKQTITAMMIFNQNITVPEVSYPVEGVNIKIYKDTDCNEGNCLNNYIEYSYLYKDNMYSRVYSLYTQKFELPKIPNLKFNFINCRIQDNYIELYAGLNHPDLGNKYSIIDLVEPIELGF